MEESERGTYILQEKPGGEILEEKPWRRNHGGEDLEEKSLRDHAREIMQERSSNHGQATME